MVGLTHEEVAARLEKHGPNELASAKLTPVYRLLFTALVHPFNLLLLLLGIVSYTVSGDKITFGFTFSMVILSSSLAFYQEFSSQRTFKAMRELVQVKARVTRQVNGVPQEMEIPVKDVVPGDIVPLKAGDVMPGDCFVLDSKNLYVSQSALTGEFLPVEKHTNTAYQGELPTKEFVDNSDSITLASSSMDKLGDDGKPNQQFFDNPALCFMSTSVISGSGHAVVVKTGQDTYINMISKSLQSQEMKGVNAFQKGIRKVAYLLLGFGAVMVPIVIVLNGVSTHDFVSAAYFGITVLVGLTPEMLPMILNTNLAYGAREMAKHKTIVRRLDAIQSIGSMDILCSDKTGTLTSDNVSVNSFLDIHDQANERVLEYAFFNSFYACGLKNVLDAAIENYGDYLLKTDLAEDPFELIDELPFDFVRRRMSVILQRSSNPGKLMLVCKGAVEETLAMCSHYVSFESEKEEDLALDIAQRVRAQAICNKLNESGLRVLAVAKRSINYDSDFSIQRDENNLTLVGFVTFMDPPKPDCRAAIEDFKNYHVGVKVLTGDNLAVAQNVCQQVGIDVTHVTSGDDLDKMTSEEFDAAAERCTLFAKLTPVQKCALVNALQRHGHTVGFLGDGINDALALAASDVGISVDTGTPLAKDAADLILLEKSLQVITKAIIRGRMTHANTIKYIKMAASSNFGNVFSMLIASAWLPFQPMTSNQILTQNFLYDFSQIAIPWDTVDKEFLAHPHEMTSAGIAKFMVFFGPLSSVFDVFTFMILWFHFGYRDPDTQAAYFQTGWFLEGMTTQALIVHMIRTQKIPFLQRWPSWPLGLGTVVVVAVGIGITYSDLGYDLGFVHMPSEYFGFMVSAIVGYYVLTQAMKILYMRWFKEWL
ncbi:magnesium-transporting ATPase [Hesseltinella vesiculosa]|uniref:Magnesium-transporting ATPase, P-type 1 n=1 Tax=Hesseltinella vesiculosa TaxID=101127 RepID=A0A1X2GXR2_9FUNG|nr:magnesium-transporting ATPase [Hesseltinella vesiculosa]